MTSNAHGVRRGGVVPADNWPDLAKTFWPSVDVVAKATANDKFLFVANKAWLIFRYRVQHAVGMEDTYGVLNAVDEALGHAPYAAVLKECGKSKDDLTNQVRNRRHARFVSAANTLETAELRAKTGGYQGSTFLQRQRLGAAAIRNIQASRERVSAASAAPAAAPGMATGAKPFASYEEALQSHAEDASAAVFAALVHSCFQRSTRVLMLHDVCKMIEEKTSSAEEFCENFLAKCRGLHTRHGHLPGHDVALQVYKKGEAIAYSSLASDEKISGGRSSHFSAKAKHVAKARSQHFFNAKEIGERCGPSEPWCLIANTQKIYMLRRMANGDDIAFTKAMPRTSGETSFITDLFATVESQWNFVYPLSLASMNASLGGLDVVPIVMVVENNPTFAVSSGARRLGTWRTYKYEHLQESVRAPLRFVQQY